MMIGLTRSVSHSQRKVLLFSVMRKNSLVYVFLLSCLSLAARAQDCDSEGSGLSNCFFENQVACSPCGDAETGPEPSFSCSSFVDFFCPFINECCDECRQELISFYQCTAVDLLPEVCSLSDLCVDGTPTPPVPSPAPVTPPDTPAPVPAPVVMPSTTPAPVTPPDTPAPVTQDCTPQATTITNCFQDNLNACSSCSSVTPGTPTDLTCNGLVGFFCDFIDDCCDECRSELIDFYECTFFLPTDPDCSLNQCSGVPTDPTPSGGGITPAPVIAPVMPSVTPAPVTPPDTPAPVSAPVVMPSATPAPVTPPDTPAPVTQDCTPQATTITNCFQDNLNACSSCSSVTPGTPTDLTCNGLVGFFCDFIVDCCDECRSELIDFYECTFFLSTDPDCSLNQCSGVPTDPTAPPTSGTEKQRLVRSAVLVVTFLSLLLSLDQ